MPTSPNIVDRIGELSRRIEAVSAEIDAMPDESAVAGRAMARINADRQRAREMIIEAQRLEADAAERARTIQAEHHAAATHRHDLTTALDRLRREYDALVPPLPAAQTPA